MTSEKINVIVLEKISVTAGLVLDQSCTVTFKNNSDCNQSVFFVKKFDNFYIN